MGPGRSLHSAVGKVEMGRPLSDFRVVQCVCAGSDGGKVSSRLSANQLVAAQRESPDGRLAWASIGVRGIYINPSMPLPVFSSKQTPSVLTKAKMSMCRATLSRERGIALPEGATMYVQELYISWDATCGLPCRSTEYVP